MRETRCTRVRIQISSITTNDAVDGERNPLIDGLCDAELHGEGLFPR